MRGTDKNVWAVGEPGLDSFNRENLLDRNELADNLGIDLEKKWVLMTYHAETRETIKYNINTVKNCLDILTCDDNLQIVVTYANADFGGKEINEYIEKVAKDYPEKIKVVQSLGHFRYLSYMKQVDFVIGNSSSGIVEAPFLNIPTINIGNRQKGRYQCGNILQCDADFESIKTTIEKVSGIRNIKHNDLNYWGNGHTSEQIVEILKKL